jgi:hypothetical protein
MRLAARVPFEPRLREWQASGKPAVSLIGVLLSLLLAYHWLSTGYPTACQTKGRRLDFGSGRGLASQYFSNLRTR